jgi:hypothetical protein
MKESIKPIDTHNEKLKTQPEVILKPASVDLFYLGTDLETSLPDEIKNDRSAQQQAEKRRILAAQLTEIFEVLSKSDVDLDSATEKGLIDRQKVTNLYENFSQFMEADENNGRIILYLPIALLPDQNKIINQDNQLNIAKIKFGQAYRNAWIRLLFESEVKASFVDGDVLEEGLGEPERIRKAGHLIPFMVEKGIINVTDILNIINLNSDPELLRSVGSGIKVTKEMGFIEKNDWEKIQQLADAKPELLDKFKVTENFNQDSQNISLKRQIWLKQTRIDAIIQKTEKNLVAKILSGENTISDLYRTGFSQKDNIQFQIAVVRALFKTGEVKKGNSIEQILPIITEIWVSNISDLQNEIISGLNRWNKLNLVPHAYLENFGVKPIVLAIPLPIDLNEYLENDGQMLKGVIRKISENKYLSENIYPIILIFGSRIKGYAEKQADTDLAVFFKPGVNPQRRSEILEKLYQEIPELSRIDKLLEFWTTEKDGIYNILPITENTPPNIVGPDQVHFLLGGAWFGKTPEIKKIYESICINYLDLSKFGDKKNEVRMQLLRQIELDMLQYRLMHKGYRRFYPSKRLDGNEYLKEIDWESDYWDEGYRQVATLLFLSRVFLPDIGK